MNTNSSSHWNSCSNGTDFPEIVTAGMIDYSGNHNISINNKTCGFSMVRCVGMTEVWTGVQKNFQGQYEFLHRHPFVILGVVILYRAFKRPAKELSKKTK